MRFKVSLVGGQASKGILTQKSGWVESQGPRPHPERTVSGVWTEHATHAFLPSPSSSVS